MARVLIAYGTGEGQTAKISEYIAEVITDRGHEAEAMDIKELPDGVSLEGYEAVIVGASIHNRKHEDYVRDFVKKNRESLERVPSAFFSVSLAPRLHTDEARRRAKEYYIEKFAEETGWHPGTIGIFAGALPYTQYGFIKRHRVKMGFKAMNILGIGRFDTDISRDYEYTNWNDVRHFAEDFLEEAG